MTFRPTPAGRKSHLPAKRPKSSQASGSAAEGIFSAAEGIFSASADPSLSDRRGLQNRESADHDTPNKPPPKGDPFPTRKAQNLLAHRKPPTEGGGAASKAAFFPLFSSASGLSPPRPQILCLSCPASVLPRVCQDAATKDPTLAASRSETAYGKPDTPPSDQVSRLRLRRALALALALALRPSTRSADLRT